ncbi:MAG: hypothetical protein KDE04_25905, partial [Anaerolineales bacterium]|nr:hypothetical protein [Anaerolineales bacterium]
MSPQPFTPQTWRERATANLQASAARLRQATNRNLPYITYGTLATMSLWPLLERAIQTGQVSEVILALYSVSAGVGSNLIASQIEKWKAASEPPEEAEVAAWLAKQATTNEAVRTTLDEVLGNLNVLGTVQTGLSEADRGWFVETVGRELQGLNSALTLTVQGHIVTATGGSIAAGRDIGTAVVGNNNRVVNHYPAARTLTDAPEWQQAYLHRLLGQCGSLTLAGIDPKSIQAEGRAQLQLTAVYTALLTVGGSADGHEMLAGLGRPKERPKPASAVAEANEHARLVLLGDPGSGKST